MPSPCATPSSSGTRSGRARNPWAAAVLVAAAVLGSAAAVLADATPPLRVLINPSSLGGYMRSRGADSAQQRIIDRKLAQLDYFRELGFTHVVYNLDPLVFGMLAREKGRWRYNQGRYWSGVDSSFWAMKREVERRGMRLIPHVNSLTHMDPAITWLDPDISEFPDQRRFEEFAASKGIPPDRSHNHVASAVDNPSMDRIFAEMLKVFLAGWGNTPLGGRAPDYVLIGHDEMGYDSVCFVKAGRNRDHPWSRSRLVAAEVARRVAQIDSLAGAGVQVMLFGDSFLPSDLGETYGLVGELPSGKGGALQILRDDHKLGERLVVIPWNYILADGDRHYWTRAPYDKERQLAYLDALGIGYLLGTGEHGSCDNAGIDRFAPPFALGYPDKTRQCLVEWLRAARRHPRTLRGYAHQTFEPFDLCSPKGLCVGYTAPILAYLAWSGPRGAGAREATLEEAAKVDWRLSRKERTWRAGRHYPRP